MADGVATCFITVFTHCESATYTFVQALLSWSAESFEELLSWNLESKLITPKYITGTYFGDIVAILDLGAGLWSRPLPLVSVFSRKHLNE